MLESFHLLRPWCIIVLPFIAIIIWKLTAGTTQTNPWGEQVSNHLKKFMIGGQDGEKNTGRHQQVLLTLLLGLLLIALLGPTMWKKQVSGIAIKPQVMILLDQSMSMLSDDVKPSRATRATHLVLDLLEKLPDAAVGLIAYAGAEHPLVPITFTHEIIEQAVNNIDPKLMPVQGNNVLPALDASTASLANLPKSTLIWITDDIKQRDEKKVIKQLKAARFETIIIGVGTKKGAPINLGNGSLLRDKNRQLVIPSLDKARIESIANKAGAKFYDHKVLYGEKIKAITAPLSNAARNNTDNKDGELQDLGYDKWEDLGPWLLIPAALLFASLFRRGFLFMLAFCLLNPTLTMDAEAKRPDQQAWEAYQQQDFQSATDLSEDDLIKGAALYQQKYYTKAAQAFANATESHPEGSQEAIQAYYNLGNALAHTDQLDAAIGAYTQVLEWQEDHQDAKFNRELLEKLKQEQEKEQEQNKENNQEKNQEQQDGEPQDGESQDGESQDGKPQDGESKDSDSQQKGSKDGKAQEEQSKDQQGQAEDQATKEAQQKALKEALEDFKQEQESENKAEEQAAQATEEADDKPEDDKAAQVIKPTGPQVENHHLEAMELQPSGVLRNKMVRQYQQRQRQQQRQRGPSDDETW